MNWEAVAAIAELLGAIGVIITLAYLAVQIRQNTKTARLSSAELITTASIQWVNELTRDPELHKLYRTGLNEPSDLDRDEVARFDTYLLQMFRFVNTQYSSYNDGMVDEDMWGAIDRSLRFIVLRPGGRESWERQKSMCSDSFQRFVNNIVAEEGE